MERTDAISEPCEEKSEMAEPVINAYLFEELKRLVFNDGYWCGVVTNRTADFADVTAAIIPQFASDIDVVVAANGIGLPLTVGDDDNLRYVLDRAGLREGHRHLVQFRVPLSERPTVVRCADARFMHQIGQPCTFAPTSHQPFGRQAGGENTVRANRSKDALQLSFSGYNDATNLSKIFMERIRTTVETKAILDWGVGAGRVSCHLMNDPRFVMYGTDIDPINMAMIHDVGYPPDRFVASKPGGDIPFANELFDGCFGISVFTHLTEELQDQYLVELARVMKPGAVGIFSVHGLLHFYAQINDARTWDRWMRNRGFLVTGQNNDLDTGFAEVAAKNLYVDVLHSRNYILEKWSRYFSRVDVVQGLTPYSHDFVICEKAG